MNYKFEYINTNGGNFDDDHLKFLETLDRGLVSAAEKNVSKEQFQEMKEQLKEAFIEIEKNRAESYKVDSDRIYSKKEKKLNADWIKAFFHKKDTSTIETELKEFQSKQFSDFIDTTLTGSQGGHLVPQLLLNEIQHYSEEHGICKRDMRYLPFKGAGNERKIPVEGTGISTTWVDESELKEISNISINQVTQQLRKLAAISVLTEEIIEDAAVNLVDYVSRRIGQAIAEEIDNQFFSGMGAPWTGLIHNEDVIPVEMEVGELIPDLSPDHLLDMIFAVNKGYRAGSKFYMSSECLLRLMKYRSSSVSSGDNEGMYLASSPMSGAPDKIWGYDLVITDALPDSESADEGGAPFLIFGNLNKCAVYGDKKDGLRIKILDQAQVEDSEGNKFNLAQQDAEAIRCFSRVGYVLTLPEGISCLQTGPVS